MSQRAITVFGSTGAVGRRVVEEALARGDAVTAWARAPDKLGALADRVRVVTGTLEDESSLDAAVEGADAVISTMGPTSPFFSGTPIADGTRRIASAMHRRGVRRLVVISTPSAPDPRDEEQLALRLGVGLVRTVARPMWREVRAIAEVTRASGLDWTIARLPILTTGRGGEARAAYVGEAGFLLDRTALAVWLVDAVDDEALVGEAPVVFSG